jgi:hypothetical protein
VLAYIDILSLMSILSLLTIGIVFIAEEAKRDGAAAVHSGSGERALGSSDS